MLLLLCGSAGAESLRLGVHPYLPATELVGRFTPLARYLEERLGRPVEIVIAATYEAHIERIAANDLTLAFLGPVPYVLLTDSHGPLPVLAVLEIEGRARFHGAVITREDTPLRSLADLAGKSVAFVDPNSTMGYVVPRYLLAQHGVTLDDLAGHKFLNSHDNVALGVLMGQYDAGAVKDETLDRYRPRGLRALAITPDIPEHVFVAGYHVKPALVEALRAALLALPQAPGGDDILRAIKADLTGLAPVVDADYDGLRQMTDLAPARRE
jgi:phosphonate transport system substrate-binding protein